MAAATTDQVILPIDGSVHRHKPDEACRQSRRRWAGNVSRTRCGP
jgi:hypothetical protein